ncbi:unnamed protein product [Hermetia illucens]|uniref:Peptidase S1 domain-containing protein n=1 Tax=Hermetia illucens TaxID=343691 RepID=A0A7R8UK47_HERIL|nr:brachyurin-like [Hermetia illucens]CAD7082340.1 unnamed protein product [Hermetia illucens]
MKWLSRIILVVVAIGSSSSSELRLLKKQIGIISQPKKNGPIGRIVGGNEAAVGRFPYQIAIINDFGVFCSGILLSENFALSVAHCIDGIFYMIAYLGVHNIREEDENWVQWVLHRDSCLLHPDWNAEIRSNDIALIEFPEPIELNSYINPIALPSRQDQKVDYSSEYVTISGWGYDDDDAFGLTPTLQYVKLRILPPEICQHFYTERIRDTNICTDTGLGRGICNGDSGVPMVYQRSDGTSVLIGIGSFISQMGCASGWPDVFTRLDRYLDWIEEVTNITISH